jgi:hypothetical protein
LLQATVTSCNCSNSRILAPACFDHPGATCWMSTSPCPAQRTSPSCTRRYLSSRSSCWCLTLRGCALRGRDASWKRNAPVCWMSMGPDMGNTNQGEPESLPTVRRKLDAVYCFKAQRMSLGVPKPLRMIPLYSSLSCPVRHFEASP